MGRWVAILATFWGLSLGTLADAKTLYILDFDGSINNDHSANPAWKTRWILFRVRDLRSLLQTSPEELNLPETIDISYGEYVQLRPYLAKGDAVLGDLRRLPLPQDPIWRDRPREIVPGYYFIDPDHSFKYYRPGRKGKNYLLRDLKDAEERHAQLPDSDGYWGLAFPLFQKALSDRRSASDLVILTARHHEQRELREFLRALKQAGTILHTSGDGRAGGRAEPRLISMHAPEALAYGRGNVASRKAESVTDLSRQFFESHDGEEHLELSPDPIEAANGIERRLHTVIVAEDTPSNIERIRKSLEALSSELGFHARMKFVLLNTSKEENLKQARWPYRWTVFHKGFGRPATNAEISHWTKISSCEGALQ